MELTHRLVSTRAGTVTLALLAALAAGVAVLVYVNHYRASVGDSGTAASVLVAKQPIPKGMSVATAVAGGYFELQTLRKDQLTSGAVVDTAAIRNQVATRDVLPGEQITTGAFGASASGLAARLTGTERAVAVTLDTPHGLAGQVQQGDHVDVLVGFSVQSLTAGTSQPVVKTLLQDVPVLTIVKSGSSVGSQSSSNVRPARHRGRSGEGRLRGRERQGLARAAAARRRTGRRAVARHAPVAPARHASPSSPEASEEPAVRRPLRTVVTLDTNVDPGEIAHALSSAGGFEIVQQATEAADRRAALAGPADLLVVGCDGDSDRAIELVAEAVAHRADRPVVVLSSHPPNGLMERLFAAGADDIVVLPEDPERVSFAIEKAVARKRGPGVPRAGRIVTVLGPKGGTGKTLLVGEPRRRARQGGPPHHGRRPRPPVRRPRAHARARAATHALRPRARRRRPRRGQARRLHR